MPKLLVRVLWVLSILVSTLGIVSCSSNDDTLETIRNSGTPTALPQRTTIADLDSRDDQTWLIMVYSDADDETLEQDMVFDINELELIGSTDNVSIVAQVDRYDGGYGGDRNWHRTRRYFITQDDNLEQINSELVTDMGEVNMADGQSLTDFATWAINTYPADHHVLILSDHGMGWPGGWSDPDPQVAGPDGLEITSGGDLLLLNEISQSLADIRTNTGIDTFDIVGFDACLMGQLEVAAAMAPHAQIMIASQEVEPALGWAYADFAGQLAEQPKLTAAELATAIVDGYINNDLRIQDDAARAQFIAENFTITESITPDEVATVFSADITLTAYDLTRIDEMYQALDDFVVAMSEIDQTNVAEARTYSQKFENVFDETYDSPYIDLLHFANVLAEDVPDNTALQQAVTGLRQAVSDTLVSHRNGGERPGASGYAIYFPVSEIYTASYASPTVYNTVAAEFSTRTRWDDFLALHYSGLPLGDQPDFADLAPAPGASEITVNDIDLSADIINVADTATLATSVTGSQIGFIYAYTGYYEPDEDTILMVDRDYIDAGVTRTVDGVNYPDWQSEQVDIEFEWEPILYGIDDGSGSLVFALLDPQDYGKADEAVTYTVEGVYTFASGKTRDARLFFKEGELIKVLGFDGSKSIGAPSVITPKKGDSFTIWNLKIALYSDDPDKEIEYYYEEGETLDFIGKPWTVVSYQAPTGDYVVGIEAQDMDGNYYENYANITVDE